MRVRNIHTANVGGIAPGREGELPRTVHTVRMVRAGLLEEVARRDVPTPPPPSSPPTGAEENSTPSASNENHSGPETAPSDDGPEDLSGLSAKKARALIRSTSDAELLGRWLGPEKRKTVRAHLEARLEDLGGSDPD